MNAYYNYNELKELGFAKLGENVLISKSSNIYGHKNISIGSNVRIDDFCVIAAPNGSLIIEGNTHIGPFSYLGCSGHIKLDRFVSISSGAKLFTSTDDYSMNFLHGPMVDSEFVNTTSGPILMREASLIGSSAIVLPNVEFGEGSVLGSLSLAMINLESHWIYSGNPAKKVRKASSLYKDKINGFIKKTQI